MDFNQYKSDGRDGGCKTSDVKMGYPDAKKAYPTQISPVYDCTTKAVPQETYVHVVGDGLDALFGSISRLERLRYVLAPEQTPKQDGADPSAETVLTFDYVWGTLPDNISSATRRIDVFCDAVKGLVYKENAECEDCCDKAAPSDHVELVNIAVCGLINIIERLERIPDSFTGQEKPCEISSESNCQCFAQLWREMPSFLHQCASRITKVEQILRSMFVELDSPDARKADIGR